MFSNILGAVWRNLRNHYIDVAPHNTALIEEDVQAARTAIQAIEIYSTGTIQGEDKWHKEYQQWIELNE